MTFLQDPSRGLSYRESFTSFPLGNFTSWYVNLLQGTARPEIYGTNRHLRSAATAGNNVNSRSVAVFPKSVNKDTHMVRADTTSAVNGLIGGLGVACNSNGTSGVFFLASTNAGLRGIWTLIGTTWTRHVAAPTLSMPVGTTISLLANPPFYSVYQNPSNATKFSGSLVCEWYDGSGAAPKGAWYRRGSIYVNSDRNVFGAQGWGPGFDNFEFRDV